MSVAFTDVLLELSSPIAQKSFQRDPKAFLIGKGLSDRETDALIDGDPLAIGRFVKSVGSEDPDQQFNRYLKNNDVLLEIDIMLEQIHEHEQTAVDHTALLIDEEGRLYRAISDRDDSVT